MWTISLKTEDLLATVQEASAMLSELPMHSRRELRAEIDAALGDPSRNASTRSDEIVLVASPELRALHRHLCELTSRPVADEPEAAPLESALVTEPPSEPVRVAEAQSAPAPSVAPAPRHQGERRGKGRR